MTRAGNSSFQRMEKMESESSSPEPSSSKKPRQLEEEQVLESEQLFLGEEDGFQYAGIPDFPRQTKVSPL